MVLSSQFESSNKEMNKLLRDNTPASRMMTTYTRRGPGQTFLKNVLSQALDDVLKDSVLNLEIDPVKASDI
jgi:Ras GTPase-activating-like protein IQGAP2/3